jgi:hypothetical protein
MVKGKDALETACTVDNKRWRREDACAIAPHAVRERYARVEFGLWKMTSRQRYGPGGSVPAASPMIVEGEWRCRASCSASRSD